MLTWSAEDLFWPLLFFTFSAASEKAIKLETHRRIVLFHFYLSQEVETENICKSLVSVWYHFCGLQSTDSCFTLRQVWGFEPWRSYLWDLKPSVSGMNVDPVGYIQIFSKYSWNPQRKSRKDRLSLCAEELHMISRILAKPEGCLDKTRDLQVIFWQENHTDDTNRGEQGRLLI